MTFNTKSALDAAADCQLLLRARGPPDREAASHHNKPAAGLRSAGSALLPMQLATRSQLDTYQMHPTYTPPAAPVIWLAPRPLSAAAAAKSSSSSRCCGSMRVASVGDRPNAVGSKLWRSGRKVPKGVATWLYVALERGAPGWYTASTSHLQGNTTWRINTGRVGTQPDRNLMHSSL
jgi:hypothetical protein